MRVSLVAFISSISEFFPLGFGPIEVASAIQCPIGEMASPYNWLFDHLSMLAMLLSLESVTCNEA